MKRKDRHAQARSTRLEYGQKEGGGATRGGYKKPKNNTIGIA